MLNCLTEAQWDKYRWIITYFMDNNTIQSDKLQLILLQNILHSFINKLLLSNCWLIFFFNCLLFIHLFINYGNINSNTVPLAHLDELKWTENDVNLDFVLHYTSCLICQRWAGLWGSNAEEKCWRTFSNMGWISSKCFECVRKSNDSN